MKHKGLLRKYFYVMGFSLFLIPVTFVLLNYIFFFSYTAITYFMQEDKPFSSSFVYANFYIFYFILLIFLVWMGSKYFKVVVNRINNIRNAVETITYDEGYPKKLEYIVDSKDEINLLSGAINKLIDRLRYKESLLEQQNHLKQEHIRQLSHDINTPLTAVMLELYELSSEYEIPEEKFNPIYSKIMYTNQLVKKVSETEEIDTKDHYLFIEECRIDLIVNQSLKKWNHFIDKHNIQLNTKIDEHVIWDAEVLLFERLLDNIFSNIVKHSQTQYLLIKLRKNSLEIQDFGIGYNTDQKTSKGKGLSIINDICDKLNLNLKITSSDKGTVYNIMYKKHFME